MVIVKLGGSLYQATELQHWLTALKKLSQQQNIIIVPGGGPFADQVRNAQQLHGFNDSYAHHMAILAMSQFGILLSGLLPNCLTFSFPTKHTAADHPLSIWLPDKQLLDQPNLAQNWDITSDSLALWLAQQCRADKLTLIKCHPPEQITSIDNLNKKGFIDNAFSTLLSQHPIPTEVIAADHYQQFTLDLPINPLHS
jgi:aspartokinase-like uncharacterized kinase